MKTIFDSKLRNAPSQVKFMVGGFLAALSLAYLYAVLNIALVVGWTPKDIAIHYYGASKRVESVKKPEAGAESEVNLDAIENNEVVDLGPRPSFKALVQEGHFHLFGMTSFFFCLTVVGLFTSITDRWKLYLCTSPYVAIVLDNLSFMATRFLGPSFAVLTAISGTIMGVSFVALWLVIVRELFLSPILMQRPGEKN